MRVNLVGDAGFSQKNKTVGRISLLELGLRGWGGVFSFFHFGGGVRGRQGLGQGVERKFTV